MNYSVSSTHGKSSLFLGTDTKGLQLKVVRHGNPVDRAEHEFRALPQSVIDALNTIKTRYNGGWTVEVTLPHTGEGSLAGFRATDIDNKPEVHIAFYAWRGDNQLLFCEHTLRGYVTFMNGFLGGIYNHFVTGDIL